MPELPEVESLRRGLRELVLGQRIDKVFVYNSKIVSGKGNKRQASLEKTREFEQIVTCKRILEIERRAKNLIFHLSEGAKILIHLKMTGQLVFKDLDLRENFSNKQQTIEQQKSHKGYSSYRFLGGHPIELSEKQLPNKHTHLIFQLDQGYLFYNDVRQFGYVLAFASLEALLKVENFASLGLEPLSVEFTYDNFRARLQTSKGTLKKVFLEQKVVVGLGNIYCDEVCFLSGIRPDRLVTSLREEEIQRLYQTIPSVLNEAISLGGSSVANYLLADGSRGNYARQHKVYRRGNLDCLVCSTKLQKTVLAGRTTVFCPKCQS